ncbi:MAG TPA: hypothetical protein VG406_19700 [Isosphaeraceae bacterium]|jgi:hypothetical protein|nr:hypothetical protein [Isosphaeraceae bacterium]
MLKYLYKDFLDNVDEYRASEGYWIRRWQEAIDIHSRPGWSYPWISTGSPDLLDGNPIFSAFSPSKRRGVRIIQHAPTSQNVEIQAWPDFVGGDFYDPDVIQELVISCALSEPAADLAIALIRPWVASGRISFRVKETEDDILLPSRGAA